MPGAALDPLLARDARDALDVGAVRDLRSLALLCERVGTRVLAGTTAKLDALDAGEVPPGYDVDGVARRWLGDRRVSWACWAHAAFAAALVSSDDGPPAHVVGFRKIEPLSGGVDLHAAVIVNLEGLDVLCDPAFGLGPVPTTGGVSRRLGGRSEIVLDSHGRMLFTVDNCMRAHSLHYRQLTGRLDAEDVETFCRVSATYTALVPVPRGRRWTATGIAAAALSIGGAATMTHWQPCGGPVPAVTATTHGSYAEAVGALIELR